MASRSELEATYQELEYRRCVRDPHYFICNYVYIRKPPEGRVLFGDVFSDAQVDAVSRFIEHRYNLFLKARQTGFTTVVMAYVLWLVLFHSYQNVLILSKTEKDAVKNLGKVIFAYNNLPQWLKLRCGNGVSEARTDKGVEKMTFLNDSVIDSLPASPQTARGEAASLVVLDEWAFWPDPENSWASLEPTVDVGGRLIAISTANGIGNKFHDMWVRAQTGDSFFEPSFYSWNALPQRTEAWYSAKAATIDEWQLWQEYPRNADEAFIKSARPYFDVDILQDWEPVKPTMRYEVDEAHTLRARMDGRLREWQPQGHQENPDTAHPQPRATYVIGCDTAEGLPHGDFTSIHVIHVQTGDVVAMWHGRMDPDLVGSQVLPALGQHFNYALIGVERNGSGLTTLTALVKAEYPYIYHQTYLDRATSTSQKKFGWSTSKVSRPLMLDELGEAIRERSIHCWDSGTRQELLGFVRDDKGRPTGSPHDDRVFSLAIAVQMLKFAHSPEYQVEEVQYGTLAYYHNRFFKKQPTELQYVVGNEKVSTR